jgi:flagellin
MASRPQKAGACVTLWTKAKTTMSLINSVNTNVGAMIALESLNKTNSDLATVQKRVSTGYRVADATDDGAAFAVAQSVRSTVGALTTANQQLGSVQGLLSTTQSGLTNISNTMASMRDVLVKLSDGVVSDKQRAQYVTQYNSYLENVKSFIQDATYSGKTLIGNISGHSGAFGSVAVVRNELGGAYTIATFGGSELYGSLNLAGLPSVSAVVSAGTTWAVAATTSGLSAGTAWNTQGHPSIAGGFPTNAAGVAALLTEGGLWQHQMDALGTALNKLGSEVNYVNNQVSYNKDKIDALNSGLGSLVDADLAKESAQLQALQIRQQLGTQALALANQAPQTLLSLFK